MSAAAAPARPAGRWRLLPPAACWEFVTFTPMIAASDWPARPGAVARGAAGQAQLLHFAPGRWLAPAPEPSLASRLQQLVIAGAGALVEVSGKWQAVALADALAPQVLASAIEVEAVLARRDCAAVVLFDCPSILARAAGGFELWVAASYLASFTRVVDTLRIRD